MWAREEKSRTQTDNCPSSKKKQIVKHFPGRAMQAPVWVFKGESGSREGNGNVTVTWSNSGEEGQGGQRCPGRQLPGKRFKGGSYIRQRPRAESPAHHKDYQRCQGDQNVNRKKDLKCISKLRNNSHWEEKKAQEILENRREARKFQTSKMSSLCVGRRGGGKRCIF